LGSELRSRGFGPAAVDRRPEGLSFLEYFPASVLAVPTALGSHSSTVKCWGVKQKVVSVLPPIPPLDGVAV
jgi:hypothetical protein